MLKKLFIVGVIVVAIILFINVRKEKSVRQPEQSAQKESTVVTTPEAAPSAVASETVVASEKNSNKVMIQYFTKKALIACSTETVGIERAIDPKYGIPEVGAMVELVKPLSKDEETTYGSAILRGTRFLSLKIDSKGTATADFSSLLDKEIKDCARVQRQAQIEKTLESFPGVKNVVITVNGKAW